MWLIGRRGLQVLGMMRCFPRGIVGGGIDSTHSAQESEGFAQDDATQDDALNVQEDDEDEKNKINVAVCAVVVLLGFGACQTPQATVVKSDLKEKLLRGGTLRTRLRKTR